MSALGLFIIGGIIAVFAIFSGALLYGCHQTRPVREHLSEGSRLRGHRRARAMAAVREHPSIGSR